jgi:hypothetical protein
MDVAARDLALLDPAKLYRRFVRWTADNPGYVVGVRTVI